MVKAVNIAAPGFLVVLIAACQASPARQAAASFGRPVRGPFIAYVVNQLSGTVTAFNTRTRMVFGPIKVGNNPVAIAITPNGKTAYVVNAGSDTVTPISTATRAALKPINVGIYPDGIAITPDGKTAYVANADSSTVTPISTATSRTSRPIRIGPQPAPWWPGCAGLRAGLAGGASRAGGPHLMTRRHPAAVRQAGGKRAALRRRWPEDDVHRVLRAREGGA
jgi:YVTN family beta-propeller protein